MEEKIFLERDAWPVERIDRYRREGFVYAGTCRIVGEGLWELHTNDFAAVAEGDLGLATTPKLAVAGSSLFGRLTQSIATLIERKRTLQRARFHKASAAVCLAT